MFKRYLSLDWFITIAGFSISAAWIILSATRHSTAQTECETEFYSDTSTANSAASLAESSDTVCNIFSWVEVGIMGGLFVVLLIMQVSVAYHIFLLRMGRLIEQTFSKAVHAHRSIIIRQIPTGRPVTLQQLLRIHQSPHLQHPNGTSIRSFQPSQEKGQRG